VREKGKNQMSQENNKTVAEIVRSDDRTADVFRKYGINYCCGGQVPLAEACALKNIDPKRLQSDLDAATRNLQLFNGLRFEEWKLDFLADYIVNVHHAYLYQTLPQLETTLTGFVNSHRKQHPELEEVLATFTELAQLLLQHNRMEEEVVFPYLKQIDNAFRRQESYGRLFVRTLRKPFADLQKEHQQVAELLQKIRTLTNDYAFSDKACTNHRVIYGKLRELDNDLVQHKHLENNILIPRAQEMERALLGTTPA
jgi:regulator of cell morphogenesis and NO signaling